MLKITQRGDFKRTKAYLLKNRERIIKQTMERYADIGLNALINNTPTNTGETAGSWHYIIEKTKTGYSISWYNNHMAGQTPVVILIQYGHATRNGGYVQGVDFINPAIQPILSEIADNAWKEITKL